jgi:hypothetical protein
VPLLTAALSVGINPEAETMWEALYEEGVQLTIQGRFEFAQDALWRALKEAESEQHPGKIVRR